MGTVLGELLLGLTELHLGLLTGDLELLLHELEGGLLAGGSAEENFSTASRARFCSVAISLRVLVLVALSSARTALASFLIWSAAAVMAVLVFLMALAVSCLREDWARASVDTASLIMRDTSLALAAISALRALRSRADLAWEAAAFFSKAIIFLVPSAMASSRSFLATSAAVRIA